MKFSTTSSVLNASGVPQDLVSEAIEIQAEMESLCEANLGCKELEVCLENLQFVQGVITNVGIEGLRVIDKDGSIESFIGNTLSAKDALEGLGQKIKDIVMALVNKLIEWWNNFWNWLKNLFKSKVNEKKIEAAKDKVDQLKQLELKPDTSTEGLKVNKVFTIANLSNKIITFDDLFAAAKLCTRSVLLNNGIDQDLWGLADFDDVREMADVEIHGDSNIGIPPSGSGNKPTNRNISYIKQIREAIETDRRQLSYTTERINELFRREDAPITRTLTSMKLDKDPVGKINQLINFAELVNKRYAFVQKLCDKAKKNVDWYVNKVKSEVAVKTSTDEHLMATNIIKMRKDLALFVTFALELQRLFNHLVTLANQLSSTVQRLST